jgi:hypothetical protein
VKNIQFWSYLFNVEFQPSPINHASQAVGDPRDTHDLDDVLQLALVTMEPDPPDGRTGLLLQVY